MPAKHKLLIKDRLMPALQQALERDYDTRVLGAEPDPKAFLAAHGASFEGLVTSAAYGADAALIDALPSLRVISSFGVGLDRIDVAEAARRGIAVGYTPDVLNDCVADLAFGLLLDVARGISAGDRFVRRGDWPRAGATPGRLQAAAPGARTFALRTRVSGKKLGIVGLGRIGRVIARRASGFDMEVRYCNRTPAAGVTYAHEASPVALARWADFLVVAAAGGAGTRRLVSSEVLDALGPKGFLVNVARGSVVDEAALVEALAQGRLGGAGLDVFENEPHVPEALLGLDNVVLLPHIASATTETRQAMADLVLDNLRSFFADGTLLAAAP
jgi:lactate dehydrogenase-like 2-hydroxyacid dehydrogenase